ncbi:MAG: hypothetical protein ACYS0F_13015 [Planctomycetota bacterium]|jgi:hypothetical protein
MNANSANRRDREFGMFLMASFMFAMTLLALAASVLVSGVGTLDQNRYLVASQKAQEAASAGIHLGIAKLNWSYTRPGYEGVFYEGVLDGSGQRAQQYRVRVFPGALDGLDNDLDGAIDEADEDEYFEMSSTGSYDVVSRTFRVTLRVRDRRLMTPGPLVLTETDAVVEINGSSHLLSADAVDVDGVATAIPQSGVGIGVMGDPTLVQDSIDTSLANIVGDPMVGQVPTQILDEYIQYAIASADVLHQALTKDLEGAVPGDELGQFGSLSDPKIIYSNEGVHLKSSDAGAGIMVVDGDLKISGGFTWTGLLIVRGSLTFAGGGGEVKLIGGAIVDGSQIEEGGAALTVGGSVEVNYSPEAVAAMQSILFRSNMYIPVSWRRGDAEE